MKILLTSGGIRNASIHDALVILLGKPIAESSALCIPTGVHPFPGGPARAADHQRTLGGPCAVWVGSRWGCWSSPLCPVSKRSTGSLWSGSSTPCWFGAAVPLPVLLDAAVRTGRPLAVAAPETVYVGVSGGRWSRLRLRGETTTT